MAYKSLETQLQWNYNEKMELHILLRKDPYEIAKVALDWNLQDKRKSSHTKSTRRWAVYIKIIGGLRKFFWEF